MVVITLLVGIIHYRPYSRFFNAALAVASLCVCSFTWRAFVDEDEDEEGEMYEWLCQSYVQKTRRFDILKNRSLTARGW